MYLIKWNGVLREEVRVAQVVKKFPSTFM